MSRTLILVKPDGVKRQLIGEVLGRFERKGLSIAALKLVQLETSVVEEHYAHLNDKPFFGELVSFMTGGAVVAAILEGPSAVEVGRQVIGATNPLEAATGSIRGDLAIEAGENIVHGSDSDENAEIEVARFFPELG
ncbi:Nucleoside diphosphate kinase [Patulibacter medicamentivorans]|uniref:Nucleoside diphosphate kinase n=1 Tax=Patulibacter medicamentivorans TaxID=1097667 RepID=H0E8J7_9ACTN|nr:nucleoside-diphosphate kinase [Patulibacter medicamentivorans]EHN09997.1 Nucleoside diphosphate kinase [Patulibacter medicamentivorans]